MRDRSEGAGLDPQAFTYSDVIDVTDRALRDTAVQPPGGRFRPMVEKLIARGYASLTLRNVTTGTDCSPVFRPANGIIDIDGFGPESIGAANWPARGQALGVSASPTADGGTMNGVTSVIR